MDKKEYMAPEVEVVKLRGPQVLLEASNQTGPDANHDDYD